MPHSRSIDLNIKLTPKQTIAWTLLHDDFTEEIGFGGGAGGGKTVLGCDWITEQALKHPGSRWFIGRKQLKDIRQTTLVSLFDVWRKAGITLKDFRFDQKDSQLILFNGSIIDLLELDVLPSDPLFERFGSKEYTGGFIEEAGEVSHRAAVTIKSRIRYRLDDFGLIPKLYLSFNPTKGWLYQKFYKPWRAQLLNGRRRFIQALAWENPHNAKSYLRSLANTEDKAQRERLWVGNWEFDDDPNAIFDQDALSDLTSNTVEEGDQRYITADLARFGRDRTVIYVWYGFVIVDLVVYDRNRLDQVAQTIQALRTKHSIPLSHVLVDEDGMGNGPVDFIRCKGFIGNSSQLEKKQDKIQDRASNFGNLRSQCYNEAAIAVNNRQIRVAVENELYNTLLVEDLEQIKVVRPDADMKVKVIPKDEIKEALQRSPDFGDAFMMRMWFELDAKPKPGIR